MALLHHFIEESADRWPSHEAFRYNGCGLSYEGLVSSANRVANALLDGGLERMGRVGILMNKCLELPVAVYGTLKAGGVFVPIDPSYPASRIALILKDCGIEHLITNPLKSDLIQELATHGVVEFVIGVDSTDDEHYISISWSEIEEFDPRGPDLRIAEEDTAYIMYTSGSTGKPKGLMHTHYSGSSYARISASTYGVNHHDRLGNHAPLHFDQSTFDYLTGPMCGATTVVIPEEVLMFPSSVGELIEQERLTFWYSVPLTLIRLVDHGQIESRDASSLRWVLFGGEAFPPKYLWRLMELWPHARFSNCYGPAEVNQCTYFHVPPELIGSADPIPIGKVWEDTAALIFDGSGHSMEPGSEGELLVSTPTMMSGYWGRPDLNEKAFYRAEKGLGLSGVFYRTGDLVRVDEHENMHFLGRIDRQIKVRGYRVELDEVESALCSFKDVAEAAAVAVRDETGKSRIIAVILPSEGRAMDERALLRHASTLLPLYAIPSRIVVCEELPRTTSGKVDRRRVAEELQDELTANMVLSSTRN